MASDDKSNRRNKGFSNISFANLEDSLPDLVHNNTYDNIELNTHAEASYSRRTF